MSPTSTLPDWFTDAAAALLRGDISGWTEAYAPDAVHEFPFAPEGSPRVLSGRREIEDYMALLPSRISFGDFSKFNARTIGNELIIEATGHHRRVPDERPITIDYVWIIKIENGKIKQFTDYMNPLQLMALAGD